MTTELANVVAACTTFAAFVLGCCNPPPNRPAPVHRYFDHDHFEDHYKDIILEVVWNGGHDSATYTFYEDGEKVK